MKTTRDTLTLIQKIIYKETVFLRHWMGQVVSVDDPMKRGRAKVSVPELGFMAGSEMWASPRQGCSVVPPHEGDWVEVYFMGGDQRRPVYLTGLGEIKDQTPKSYSDPKKAILWENPKTGDYLQYDEEAKELIVSVSESISITKYGKLTIGGGSESFTLGDTLSTFLSNLKTWLDSHMHPTAATGSPSPPTVASPSVPNVKSDSIKGE